MKTLTIVALLGALALLACGQKAEQGSSDFVNEAGAAPYYTNLESALTAAGPDQYVAVDFYTDW